MPAPFVPVADTAHVGLQLTQPDGSYAQNGFWVHRDEAWDSTKLLALCASVKTAWNTNIKPDVCPTYALGQVTARDYTTESGVAVEYTTGLPLAGTGDVSHPAAAPGITFALSFKTGLAGRSYRGRVYWLGMAQAAFSDATKGLVDGTYAGAWVTAWSAMLTAVNASDGSHNTLVVCSRQHGGHEGAPAYREAGVVTPVTEITYHDLYADFQRRRAPGHNRHH